MTIRFRRPFGFSKTSPDSLSPKKCPGASTLKLETRSSRWNNSDGMPPLDEVTSSGRATLGNTPKLLSLDLLRGLLRLTAGEDSKVA